MKLKQKPQSLNLWYGLRSRTERRASPPQAGIPQVRGGCVGGERTAYHQVSECEALPVRERAGRPRAVRAKFQGGGRHAA